MGGFEKFCWIVTILASLAAAAVLAAAVFAREFAAPQEAVLAAVGVGIAIVPYVFTRGIQALGRDARQRAAGRLLPAEPAPAAKAAPRETPPLVVPKEPVRSRVEAAPRETPPPLGVPQEPVPSQAEPPIELPAGEPAPEPPRGRVARERLFPRPRPAAPEDPAPSQAERSIELPAGEPSPEPPKGLVARERLVPPAPPPPRRSGLERAFWVLIGILVVIIVVGIILIRNGP
jgi:hypothetical protein